MNCQSFKRSLYHFQAAELPADEQASCQEHLNVCSACAALLEVEDGLLRGLRARLVATPAPPGLETRVRALLADERDSGPPGLRWLRAPWFVAMTASALLAILLFPIGLDSVETLFERVVRDVVVVDRDCDRMGKTLEQQLACRHPRHLNVLKLADGSYWQVSLEQEAGRALVTDTTIRGKRMRVEGLFYRKIQTLQVEQATELSLVSALRIRTDEP